jgi:hypothetical protein
LLTPRSRNAVLRGQGGGHNLLTPISRNALLRGQRGVRPQGLSSVSGLGGCGEFRLIRWFLLFRTLAANIGGRSVHHHYRFGFNVYTRAQHFGRLVGDAVRRAAEAQGQPVEQNAGWSQKIECSFSFICACSSNDPDPVSAALEPEKPTLMRWGRQGALEISSPPLPAPGWATCIHN